MLRSLVLAALVAIGSTGAQAQIAGGPPIAYVKRLSNGDEIHLVSPTGTDRLLVYKARSKVRITMMDLRPGGGEVAFTEDNAALKILAFDEFGRPLQENPREIRRVSSPCSVESPDYHPADGRLLFVEGCGRDRAVRTVQPGASSADSASLFSQLPVFRARWSRLGDVIYYIGLRPGASASDPTYLYRRTVASAVTDELGVLNSWSTFDVAREGEKLFWSNGNNTFSMLDLTVPGATTSNAAQLTCPRGVRMSFSPGDTGIAYTSEPSRGAGNYLMVGPADCGTPSALTGKGDWGWVDWRTDAAGAGAVTTIAE